MNHRVALIDWSHLLEDFLDNIGLSLEQFCQEMTGGWLFGYIDALQKVGTPCVLFCFTARLAQAQRVIHRPTGAVIWLVPSSKSYRWVRKRILNPYVQNVWEAAGYLPWYKVGYCSLLLQAAPYLNTPLKRLAKLLKEEACTHILCQDYEHARFDLCVWLGTRLGMPIYASFQGGNWQLSKWEKVIRPWSLKRCSGLIIAAQTEMQRVQQTYQLPAQKIAQIFNPIDLSMWSEGNREDARKKLGLDPTAKIAIWHGRIDLQRKGLDLLLQAWVQVLEQIPGNLQLYILGDGNDHQAFAALLKENPQPSVTWLARYLNDRALIATWLKAANLYVFPSRNEGFPVAPIEALACGLPLVACAAPGVPDILAEGQNSGGIMVPREDVPALVQAIKKVLSEDGLRAQLASNALRRAQSAFSLEEVGLQLQKFMKLT